MKKVFISHPFADDPICNPKKANAICQRLIEYEDNILPISPLHLFGYLSSDEGVRDDIMDVCFRMLDICDEVYFYKYGELSAGQCLELQYSMENHIPYKIIPK